MGSLSSVALLQGQCLGRDFVMRLGEDAFTPDVMFIRVNQLEQHHHWFFDGATDLVIEVLLPEHAQVETTERFRRYEAGGVSEYWIVDPVAAKYRVVSPYQARRDV